MPHAKVPRTQTGRATTDLVCSAQVGRNAEMFRDILQLHVPPGSTVADVTYGSGAFWRTVDIRANGYDVLATDIAHDKKSATLGIDVRGGVDCRNLDYENGSIDALVLDPPYLEGFYRQSGVKGGGGSLTSFSTYYSNGSEKSSSKLKWHDAVLEMYLLAGAEAHRVLVDGGKFVVKCQDEVSAGRQRLTHVELIAAYEKMGFYTQDLFVVVRANSPGVSRIKRQLHARKNHSYFLVFERLRKGRRHPARNTMIEPERYGVSL